MKYLKIGLIITLTSFSSFTFSEEVANKTNQDTTEASKKLKEPKTLPDKVKELNAYLKETKLRIKSYDKEIKSLTKNTSNPGKVADKMIKDFDDIIQYYNEKSEFAVILTKEIKKISTDIAKYSKREDEFFKNIIKGFKENLTSFKNSEDRRRLLVASAIKAKRGLENMKEKIALAVKAKAYNQLANVYTSMMNDLEEAVGKAEGVQKGILNTSEIDRQ